METKSKSEKRKIQYEDDDNEKLDIKNPFAFDSFKTFSFKTSLKPTEKRPTLRNGSLRVKPEPEVIEIVDSDEEEKSNKTSSNNQSYDDDPNKSNKSNNSKNDLDKNKTSTQTTKPDNKKSREDVLTRNLRFWNLKQTDLELKEKIFNQEYDDDDSFKIIDGAIKINAKYTRFGGYFSAGQCSIEFSKDEIVKIDITGI
jgi:hypothetical protein